MNSFRMKNVLLVEDDEFQRRYFQEVLEGEGYYVRAASNG